MGRFVIAVEPAGDDAWEVSVHPGKISAQPIAQRTMRRFAMGGVTVPLPPVDNALAADAPHRTLCTADDPQVIESARARIAARQPNPNEIESFGRYLFESLLGDDAWGKILQAAGEERFELALRWSSAVFELSRLPWEMLHGPDGEPLSCRAVVTRLIPAVKPADAPERLALSPTVLFVVGSSLTDERIRPGAEYFGVCQRLQNEGVLFDFRLLQRATSEEIEQELQRFRASIVHMICHGGLDDGEGYLEFVSSAAGGTDIVDQRPANQLLDMLKASGGLPPILVLNACFSGAQPGQPLGQTGPPVSRVPAPLAAKLVEGGIPIVVGMGGRVSDRACRLFARRFYEALLKGEGESVTDAVAEARRAGITHGTDPKSTVDWALPALFLAEWVSPQVDLMSEDVERLAKRAERAAQFRKLRNPPVFCGRIEVLEGYERVVGQRGDGKTRVLALDEIDAEAKIRNAKFGKSRAIQEVAVRAVQDGHVPCLVTIPAGTEPPTTPIELSTLLWRAIARSWETCLQPPAPTDFALRKLIQRFGRELDDTVELDETVEQKYQDWRLAAEPGAPLGGEVLAAALRIDLVRLEQAARTQFGVDDAKAVVLVDDFHLLGSLVKTVLDEMVWEYGLGAPEHPVPFVFSFSRSPREHGYDSVLEVINDWIEQYGQSPFLAHVKLERFKSTETVPFSKVDLDPLALIYQQYLLHLTPPIVIKPAAASVTVRWFFEALHQRVEGIPSKLEIGRDNDDVDLVVQMALGHPLDSVLDKADDDDLLAQIRQGGE